MGLFDFLKKKESAGSSFMTEEEKLLNGDESGDNVVIPTHVKDSAEKKSANEVVENVFVVTGVYDIGSEVMFSGVVKSGALKKKMKTIIEGKDSFLTDLKVDSSSVKEMKSGSKGSVFLKGKNLFLVKIGDILKFK